MVFQEALAVLKLGEDQLAQMPKSAREKGVRAWWLRQRTTLPLRWVSERLATGHVKRVSRAIGQVKRAAGWKQSHLKRLVNLLARQQMSP